MRTRPNTAEQDGLDGTNRGCVAKQPLTAEVARPLVSTKPTQLPALSHFAVETTTGSSPFLAALFLLLQTFLLVHFARQKVKQTFTAARVDRLKDQFA